MLESTLGVRLSDVTFDVISDLITRRVVEDVAIDFKRTRYGIERHIAREQINSSPKAKSNREASLGGSAKEDARSEIDSDEVNARVENQRAELAKDVIAFANAGGGLIVLGVVDSNGRAHHGPGVPLNDTHKSRILDTIRERTTPYISGIEVGHVPSPTEAGQGFVLIYVPASVDGPHAESAPNQHRYRFAVRDGSHTRSLTQPQIAIAYRDRFSGRTDINKAVADVFDTGVGELDTLGRAWLAVAAVPARSAIPRMLDSNLLDEVVQCTRARQDGLPGPHLGHHASYGRGRVVLRDSPPDRSVSDHLLHCYTNGRAFAAVTLDLVESLPHLSRHPELEDDAVGLRIGSLTHWALTLIGTVAGHLADTGAAGNVELQCGVITSTSPKYFSQDGSPADRDHVICDQTPQGAPGSRNDQVVAGSVSRKHLTPVTMSVSPLIASDAQELASVAAQVITEVVVEFGRVPTYPIITGDGFVRVEHCDPRLERLVEWARRHELA
ncbi:ATP-binding protein [Nocardioides sp. 1609]|uniref:AlbA family DNA-binding domain-containing protein n=1 Tax=Nocardioides sp. 1609 TaxID=2508327 RepID=UPI00142FD934|nr:ATP-binding protein [Nocardioides sp. 1609]